MTRPRRRRARHAVVLVPIRRFAERDHKNIVQWSEFERGSHHATQNAPDLLVDDMRKFFRRFR